jgi:hypothetical protein
VALGIWLAIFLRETPMTSNWLTEEEKMLFQQDVSVCVWGGGGEGVTMQWLCYMCKC